MSERVERAVALAHLWLCGALDPRLCDEARKQWQMAESLSPSASQTRGWKVDRTSRIEVRANCHHTTHTARDSHTGGLTFEQS